MRNKQICPGLQEIRCTPISISIFVYFGSTSTSFLVRKTDNKGHEASSYPQEVKSINLILTYEVTQILVNTNTRIINIFLGLYLTERFMKYIKIQHFITWNLEHEWNKMIASFSVRKPNLTPSLQQSFLLTTVRPLPRYQNMEILPHGQAKELSKQNNNDIIIKTQCIKYCTIASTAT